MALLTRISICFTFFLISNLGARAQQAADTSFYRVKWQGYKSLVVEGKQKRVISFYTAIHLEANKYLPLLSLSFDGKHFSEATLQEPVWQEIDQSETSLLPDVGSITNQVAIEIDNGWSNREPLTSVSFIPLRRSSVSGKIEKLTKFKLRLVDQQPVFSSTNLSRTNSQLRLEATGSVLAQGDWFKMGFNTSGIYKIDYYYLLQVGIKPDSINPNNIQIWGNGGGMLPEPCSASRPIDLTENPIYFVGGEDGKFDIQDYILFYVQGPNSWKKNTNEPFYRSQTHIYSSQSFYFLTIGNTPGKRVSKRETLTNPEASFTTYNCRYSYEKDNVNFLSSGRKWFGEAFEDKLSQTFVVPSTGVVSGGNVYLISSLLNKSTASVWSPSTFRASLNGQLLNTYSLPGAGIDSHGPIGVVQEYLESKSSDLWANTTNLNINYTYAKSREGLGTGYLDYFTLNFEENLAQKSNPLDFRQIKSSAYGTVAYTLTKTSPIADLKIWDVSDLGAIQEMQSQNTQTTSTFVDRTNSTVKEYIAFYGSNFPLPVSFSSIPNQNIAATETPNLLIVTHPLFKDQAEKLAEFRRTNDGLDVVVATTEEIYNEFASGAQDLVAIRDCAKMYYNRADGAKFKYLLLFGDASFDYKNLLNYSVASSYVPIYESEESMHPINSYSSDDYVGMLAADKGDWESVSFFEMDIGVGRLPVKSSGEAESVLNKLIIYGSSPASLGPWRDNVAYVADNIEEPGEDAFIKNAEDLAGKVEAIASQYNIKKIYIGAYPKEVSPNGTTAPGVNKDIISALNTDGSLFLDYIGHGGIDQWAAENILNSSMIRSLTNINKLSFLVTATCNFGQYDIPSFVSGGEELLLQSQGGAVGLLTTTRAVYQGSNEILNDAFHDNVFLKIDGEHVKLGDIIRRTKNGSKRGAELVRNFALLGDPSATLAYPKDTIVITEINGRAYAPRTDTLKAKEKVTITGQIRNAAGQKQDFNGVVNVVLYDKKTDAQTIDIVSGYNQYPFKVLETKIFNGSATVKNGDFSFTLVIPRNINYNVGLGKISLYANTEDGKMSDASCGENGIFVGSSDTSTIIDNTPPVIKLFMNDESFVPGGFTNEKPLFLVKLFDEQGISGVGGVGRSITATLNNNSKNSIVLDSYYKTDRDTYKSGTIRYQLSDLREGQNTITLKAFDTDTNSATSSLDFVVAATKSLSLQHILNYPNPFTTNTSFHFDHNRPGDDLDVMIQVFTVAGRLVKTMLTSAVNANTHFSDLHWDGKDDYGDEIGRGIYVYKVSVKAMSDGSKIEEYQKLVILN